MTKQKKPPEQTNAEYAKTSTHFRSHCLAAGVEPTKRQASKFRRGVGSAYNASR